MKSLFVAAFLLLSFSVMASVDKDANTATIVKKAGKVEIFSNPSDTIQGPPPHALFEGKHYSVREAKVGDSVVVGDVLRTGASSQVMVVFKNGDQFNIGAETAYKVMFEDESVKSGLKSLVVNFMYGKIRAIISKTGPRNNMKVKTQTISLGVRGTDFYVNKPGARATSVSVLRGEVAVKAAPKPVEAVKPGAKKPVVKEEKVEEVRIASGFSAEVKQAEAGGPAPVVALQKTTRTDLVKIQAVSTIKPQADEKVDVKVAEKIKALEQKAVETTIQDIAAHDPKLYEQLKNQKIDSVASLNTAVVKKEYKDAPEGPAKPSDLDSGEYDVYEKYLKVE